MSYEILKNIIETRRSIRKFVDEPVPKDVFEKIINCARWAPSSTNSQPWKFIGISNKGLIEQIAEAVEGEMLNFEEKLSQSGNLSAVKSLHAFSKYTLFFRNAPGIIMCLYQPYKSRFSDETFFAVDKSRVELFNSIESIKSTSLAAQNILLAAHSLGYGTCAMSAPIIFGGNKIKQILNISEEYSIMLLIAIGKPAEEVRPTPRKGMEEIFEYIGTSL